MTKWVIDDGIAHERQNTKFVLYYFITAGVGSQRYQPPLCVSILDFQLLLWFSSVLYCLIVTGENLDPQLNRTTQTAPN